MTIQPFPKRTDWLHLCLCGDTGKPLPVLANALIALNNDPALRDAFAYDEMLRAPMLMHEIGQPLMGNLPSPKLLTDKDVSDIQNWFPKKLADLPIAVAAILFSQPD